MLTYEMDIIYHDVISSTGTRLGQLSKSHLGIWVFVNMPQNICLTEDDAKEIGKKLKQLNKEKGE